MTVSAVWRASGVDRPGVDPVVLLPGIGGDAAHDFAWLAPMLARTRLVIEIDLGSPDAAVSAVLAVLAEAVPGRSVTLLGYSFGATVALEVAASLPLVSRLLLVAGVISSDERQRLFASTWAALGGSSVSQGQATFARFAAASFERDPFPLGEGADAQVSALASFELEASASRVTVPTLVVGFTEDAIAGTGQALRLFAAIDDCRYAELDGGHATLLDRPAEVLSLVDGFLAGSYPAGSRVAAVSA